METKKFKKLLRLNNLPHVHYLTENEREILEKNGLFEEYSSLFSIPKRWTIKNSEFVGKIYDKLCRSDCYSDNEYKYLRSHNFGGQYIFTGTKVDASFAAYREDITEEYPEITLEQFKRLYDEVGS